MTGKAEFIQGLAKALTEHGKTAPLFPDYFQGAVLVPLLYHEGEISLLFEVRSLSLTWQPGEICFPGGRMEESDANPEAAAVRETSEELGVNKQDIRVIGSMEPILSPLGLILYPTIGYIEEAARLFPNRQEVAEVFMVPLSYLLATEPQVAHMEMGTRPLEDFPFELLGHYPEEWKKRKTYRVLFYQYQGRVIWGLTAQVLQPFLKVCSSIK